MKEQEVYDWAGCTTQNMFVPAPDPFDLKGTEAYVIVTAAK
jgi:hypothetical protein